MNRVEGLSDCLRNLNSEIKGIEKRSMGGILAGASLIIREAKKTTNTPRDLGNLVNSAYFRKAQGGGHFAEMGFTANYALYVHEDLEAHHKKGRAKFLEIPMNEKKEEAFELIRRAAEIK